MRRFYFDLFGRECVVDKSGCLHDGPVDAFKAAERLARDIAGVRPNLCGNTFVVMTEQRRPFDCYCVGVSAEH